MFPLTDDDVEVLDDIEEEIADDDVEEVNLDDSEEIDEDILDNSGGEGDSNGLIEIKPNQSEKPTDSKPSENVTDEQSNKKDSLLEESNINTEEKTQNESESKTE